MGKFKVEISDRTKRHLSNIEKSGDKASIKKIQQIVFELYEHPETGTGRPERLKFDLEGYWSRRIKKKDRLVYRIDHEIVTVTIISAIGHYDDR